MKKSLNYDYYRNCQVLEYSSTTIVLEYGVVEGRFTTLHYLQYATRAHVCWQVHVGPEPEPSSPTRSLSETASTSASTSASATARASSSVTVTAVTVTASTLCTLL